LKFSNFLVTHFLANHLSDSDSDNEGNESNKNGKISKSRFKNKNNYERDKGYRDYPTRDRIFGAPISHPAKSQPDHIPFGKIHIFYRPDISLAKWKTD
jgi:hypothetical protein